MTMTKFYNHGLAVMRAQPLHNGHMALINKMLRECDKVTIVLGSAQESYTEKNPFSVFERRRMLGNVFPGQLNVASIEDIGRPDLWAQYVIGKVAIQFSNCLPPDVYYAGSDEDAMLFDEAGIKTTILYRDDVSGSFIREMLLNNDYNWKNFIPEINHPMIENHLKGRRRGQLV